MAKIENCSFLTPQNIRELKSKVHHLKPVVIIGNNGLTEAVIQEINSALTAHELIKIRAAVKNSEELSQVAKEICIKTESTLIHTIGHIIAIYRKTVETED